MALIGLSLLFVFIFAITEDNKKQLYWCLGLIFAMLVCWIVLRELTVMQNYKIDKNTIIIDRLRPSSNNRELLFSKKLTVEITEFDMPMGGINDYTNYRIYLDSLTYIDVNSSSFDSLHIKYGKKLYKE